MKAHTPKYEEFKDVISKIRTINSVVRNEEDKKVISDLSKVLLFTAEYDIAQKMFEKNNDVFVSLENSLQVQINNLLEKRKNIFLQNSLGNNIMSETDKAKVANIARTVNYLQSLRTAVSNRDIKEYTKLMEQKLNTARSIFTVCKEKLTDGVDLFTDIFGSNLIEKDEVSEEAIDSIFKILNNNNLKVALEAYARRELLAEECKDERDKYNLHLHYLELVERNQSLVVNYFRVANRLFHVDENDLENKYISDLEEYQKEIMELDNQNKIISIVRSSKQIVNDLKKKYYFTKGELDKIENLRIQKEKIQSTLNSIGLKPVLECYYTDYDIRNMNAEELTAQFIKDNLVKSEIDLTQTRSKIINHNMELMNKREKHRGFGEGIRKNLNREAQEILNKYKDNVMNLFRTIIKGNNMSKELALYVLKAISDSRSLSFNELITVCKVNNNEYSLTGLVNKYDEIIHNFSTHIENEIAKVQDYDLVSEPSFGK